MAMPRSDSASPLHYPISGWIEAGLFVVAIAVLSVTYVVGQQIGAHPVALILYAMLASAVALLAVTGVGPDALRIALAPQSWLVGIGTIGIEVFYYALLEHVGPAHGSLLLRVAIPLALLIGWMLFARRPRRLSVLGAGVVVLGIAPLVFAVDGQHRGAVTMTAVAAALSSNLRGFAAEFHPWNRRAKTVLEKLRVTGLVVLVTSLASLALTGGLALSIAAGWMPATELVPTADQMLHGPTIVLGTIVVGALLTAMAALSFSAVVKITTENFTATHAFTPVATLLAQVAASAIGLIPGYALDPGLVPAMATVIGGVLLMLYAARRR
jgi:drug/metabolite transporter (DMT)-like permease